MFQNEAEAKTFAQTKFDEGLIVYAGTINPSLPRRLIPSSDIPSWLEQEQGEESADQAVRRDAEQSPLVSDSSMASHRTGRSVWSTTTCRHGPAEVPAHCCWRYMSERCVRLAFRRNRTIAKPLRICFNHALATSGSRPSKFSSFSRRYRVKSLSWFRSLSQRLPARLTGPPRFIGVPGRSSAPSSSMRVSRGPRSRCSSATYRIFIRRGIGTLISESFWGNFGFTTRVMK